MSEPTEFLRISDSSLGTFSTCARKFEFNKMYPRRQRDSEMYAADVGTALHAGYQSYLIHGDEERAVWDFMLKFPYALEYSQEKEDRSFFAALSSLEAMMESTQLYEYELATIRRPATTEELAANPTVLFYDVPAIEVPFEITFKGIVLPDGRGVKYTGFIDAVMRHKISGEFRSTDIKTHRRFLKDATPKYKYAGQQVPYGIVIDHIAGQGVESFKVLYLDVFVDLLEPRVHPYEFNKSQDDLQEWLLDTVLELQRIQRYMEMNHFPRTRSGCLTFNAPCYFFDVCESRDRAAITEMFLLGEEPAVERVTQPWIVADIDLNG